MSSMTRLISCEFLGLTLEGDDISYSRVDTLVRLGTCPTVYA